MLDMEEEGHQDKAVNGAGKLINLNAPLLSTRRMNNIVVGNGIDRLEVMPRLNAADSSGGGVSWNVGSCERIPFSWEQSPGKPKKYYNSETSAAENDDCFLPPRPPPGRWSHLIRSEAAAACWEYDFNKYNNGNKVVVDEDHIDDGCDGDLDDDDDDDNDGNWSNDGLDIFSLAQSIETNETRDRGGGGGCGCCRSTLTSLEVEEEDEDYREDYDDVVSPSPPNFMIQRFLPDARALAAESSSSAFMISTLHHPIPNSSNKYHRHLHLLGRSNSRGGGRLRQSSPFSSSKGGGCGLDSFLPWRFKPIKSGGGCGVLKSPVVEFRTTSSKFPSSCRPKLK